MDSFLPEIVRTSISILTYFKAAKCDAKNILSLIIVIGLIAFKL